MAAIKRFLNVARRRHAVPEPPARQPGPDERAAYVEALRQLGMVDHDLALEAARDLGTNYHARYHGQDRAPSPDNGAPSG